LRNFIVVIDIKIEAVWHFKHDIFLAAGALAFTALDTFQTISLQNLRIVTNLLPVVIEEACLAFIWILVRGIDVSTVLVETLRF